MVLKPHKKRIGIALALCSFFAVFSSFGQEAATSRNERAVNLTQKGKHSEADSLFQSALALCKEAEGEESLLYADILYNYSVLKNVRQDFSEVEQMLKQSAGIRKKQLGGKHPLYGLALNLLGNHYLFAGEVKKSLKELEAAEKILRTSVGVSDTLYAQSMVSFGHYYLFAGNFNLSEEYYNKAVQIYEQALTEDNYDYLNAWFSLSTLKASKGELQEATGILLRLLPIAEKHYGKHHEFYSGGISNLGGIYFGKKDFDKAEPLLTESLQITEEMFGKRHLHYFNALNLLGLLYQEQGAYEKAEGTLKETLSLRKEVYGETHNSVQTALNNLANLYMDIGKNKEAQRVLLEVLNIDYETQDTLSYHHALHLTNLGLLAKRMNEPLRSLEILEKSKTIQEKLEIPNRTSYLATLDGILNIKQLLPEQDKKEIEQQMLYITEQRRLLFDTNNMDYIKSISTLVVFYILNEEYEKAELWSEKGLEAYDNSLYKGSSYIHFLTNVADSKHKVGKWEDAYAYCREILLRIQEEINNNFASLSEKEQELFWKEKAEIIETLLAIAVRIKDNDPSIPGFVYDCVLFSKSLLLNSFKQIHLSVMNSGDPSLIGYWEATLRYKKAAADMLNIKSKLVQELAAELSLNSESQVQEFIMSSGDREMIDMWNHFARVEREAMEAEKEIGQEIKLYQRQQQDINLKWQDLQKQLSDDDICIEFVSLEAAVIKNWDIVENKWYSALVLSKEMEAPLLLDLCTAEELQQAIQQSPYSAQYVFPLVWQPLEPFLKGKKNIYLTPSGLLHAVSFAGIEDGNGAGLHSLYNIHLLLSSKDLITIKQNEEKQPEATFTAVLFGGADFGLPEKEVREADSDIRRGQGFDYLPGSKKEVDNINKLLNNLQWESHSFTDKYATEARFKALSSAQSPRLIHISTHGFYLPAPDIGGKNAHFPDFTNTYQTSDNPLMRCGLVLTGGNKAWQGDKIDSDREDGILTAYEVSNMNLSNTELVVLSACETGLGDINNSEGIYGLQRAFKLAGVKNVLVSLWKIPDKETVELMYEFYKHWSTGLPVCEAFRRAQNTLKIRYPEHPELWAGFILIQ